MDEKYFEHPGDYGNEFCAVKLKNRWVIAHYNSYHSNWVSGDAFARTPRAAAEYAHYASHEKFRSAKAAIESVENGHNWGIAICPAEAEAQYAEYQKENEIWP